MFRAVRQWWVKPRHQRTLRLFVFELSVVMIGVLAAQQISSWAQKRASLQQVESVHEGLLKEYGVYRAIAVANQAALPCLSDRVKVILQRASSRDAVDSSLLTGAHLIGMDQSGLSTESEQLLRERYGDTQTNLITSVAFVVREVGQANNQLEEHWVGLQRLNPSYGPVTDADRSAARAEAVQILGDLATLRRGSNAIVEMTGQLGLDSRNHPIRPVRSCARLWQTHSGFEQAALSGSGQRPS